MDTNVKQPLNKRALTSLFLVFSLLLLPVSGIPLHFNSAGEDAVVLRHFLMSVHNVSATIFIISLVIHLSYNWKALMKYVAIKSVVLFKVKREFLVALAATAAIVALFSSHAFHIR